ncbi:hypothetical protein VNO80_11765 [Phaseolus coccineus]|uniref:Uncharacterized protein n=1 Tax=Phaseolus coccineus TaxID=3886 RepID=A0AAN9RF96_PHACN
MDASITLLFNFYTIVGKRHTGYRQNEQGDNLQWRKSNTLDHLPSHTLLKLNRGHAPSTSTRATLSNTNTLQ